MRNNHPGHLHNGHQANSPNSLLLVANFLNPQAHTWFDNILQYLKIFKDCLLEVETATSALYEIRRSTDESSESSTEQSAAETVGEALPPTTDPPTTTPPPDNSLYGHCSLSAAQNVKVRDVWMRCSSKKKVWIPFQVLSIAKTSFWEFGNKKVSILMNWRQSTKSIETMWNESKVKRKLTHILRGVPTSAWGVGERGSGDKLATRCKNKSSRPTFDSIELRCQWNFHCGNLNIIQVLKPSLSVWISEKTPDKGWIKFYCTCIRFLAIFFKKNLFSVCALSSLHLQSCFHKKMLQQVCDVWKLQIEIHQWKLTDV